MTDHEFYLDLKGSPRELGLAHGEAFRTIIQGAIGRWQEEMSDATKMPFDDLLEMFNATHDYKAAIMHWAPHVYEEMQFIAIGADVSEELVYAWQLFDEFIDFVIEHIYIEKCTTVGGYEQGDKLPPVLGKTQDLPKSYVGAGALIRTRYSASDTDILNSTIAGIVCQDGMNKGLGVCANHVGQLERSATGLPVTFLTRLLLERCFSIQQGVNLLTSITHASGMNYALIDKHSVRTFEVSSNRIEEFVPAPDLKRIWHTNHPLANDHYCRNIAIWDQRANIDPGNTHARFDFIEREARRADIPMSSERVMKLLSSREVPVSSLPEDPFPTICSTVIEFRETPTLFFAPGPPSEADYISFSLT